MGRPVGPDADRDGGVLTDVLAWAEGLGWVRVLRTSLTLYPLINGAHILSFGTLLGTIVAYDIAVLRGRADAAVARATLPVARWAFALAALTGGALFATRAQAQAANTAMQAKSALLLLSLVNVAAFHRARSERARRFIAAASVLLWVGVVLAGRWIGFV